MADFKFEVIEDIGDISTKASGWKKKLTFVKWGDNDPKFDIREWSEDMGKMGKGVTLTQEELEALRDLINEALA